MTSPTRHKYPRTFHLPWSRGQGSDDKTLTAAQVQDLFEGQDIVVTEKVDGENSTIYADGVTHARSLDSRSHPSRDWLRAFAATVAPQLPQGWRLVGENLYAKHSIFYDRLPSYFLLFGVIDADNRALAWADVEEWAALLDVATAPVLFRGPWEAWTPSLPASAFGAEVEGYVVRVSHAFHMDDFSRCAAKYVRAGHVQTDEHWMHAPLVLNRLISETP